MRVCLCVRRCGEQTRHDEKNTRTTQKTRKKNRPSAQQVPGTMGIGCSNRKQWESFRQQNFCIIHTTNSNQPTKWVLGTHSFLLSFFHSLSHCLSLSFSDSLILSHTREHSGKKNADTKKQETGKSITPGQSQFSEQSVWLV